MSRRPVDTHDNPTVRGLPAHVPEPLALQAALDSLSGDVAPAPPGATADPVKAYLSTLLPASRRVQATALARLGRELIGADATEADALAALSTALPKITSAHVLALRTKLLQTQAPATVNRHLAALRGAVQAARRLGIVTLEHASDLADVKGAREDHGKGPSGRAIAPEELRAMVAVGVPTLRYEIHRRRALAVLAILAGAGLRRAEVAGLTWSDIDWGMSGASTPNGQPVALLTVRGKGGKTRKVPVPGWAREALQAWAKYVADSRASSGPSADPFTPGWADSPASVARDPNAPDYVLRVSDQVIYDLIETLGRAAKIDPLPRPHDFRRTWITALLDSGLPVARVAELAGHSDVQTTMRYVRETRTWRAAAGAAVEAIPDPMSPSRESP